MDSEARKRTALDLIEAMDAGDTSKAIALVHPDFHLEVMLAQDDATAGGAMRLDRRRFEQEGIPVIRAVTVDGMHFAIEDVVCEGDVVVVFAKSDATTRSEKPYRNVYAWKVTFSDEKIIEFREYCDTRRAMELLTGQ